jgi:hypothetical protein
MIRTHGTPTSTPPNPAQKESSQCQGIRSHPAVEALPLSFRHSAGSTLAFSGNRPVLEIPFPRCSVKGCIFPAASTGGRLCLVHNLAEKEPNHFLSVQPSTLCLDRAKYGIAESGHDDARARDRRRLSIQIDQLRDEVA